MSLRVLFAAVLLSAASCGGASVGEAQMPRHFREDAADGVLGGGAPSGEVVGTYSIFQVLGCTGGSGEYVAPPPGQLRLVSASVRHRSSDVPTAVVRSEIDAYPEEIHNAYSEDGERMWFAYRPEGEAYQLVLPLDWEKPQGRTQLISYESGSYEVEVTGNQYRIRGTPHIRCQLAVLWVGTNFHPKFTAPTAAELADLALDYKAALASDAGKQDAEARHAARLRGYEGVNVLHIGEYNNAVVVLELAYSKLKTPSLALWSARALAQAGRVEEAITRYIEATQLPTNDGDPGVQRRAQQAAASELAALSNSAGLSKSVGPSSP